MKLLTKEEMRDLKDLENNIESYVERYRKIKQKELKQGGRKNLENELETMASYMEESQKGTVPEAGGITFDYKIKKISVLKDILKRE